MDQVGMVRSRHREARFGMTLDRVRGEIVINFLVLKTSVLVSRARLDIYTVSSQKCGQTKAIQLNVTRRITCPLN